MNALRALCLLDTPRDAAFDLITEAAAAAFGVPVALISLIDEDRQWFKSRVGMAAQETPREQAFCAHAIHGADPLIVLDATQDERFADNPLVMGTTGIRFYAGVPIEIAPQVAIGTLCVIDTQPRVSFGARQVDLLRKFGELVRTRIQTLQAVGSLDALTHLPNRARFEIDINLRRREPSLGSHPVVAAVVDVCGAMHCRSMANALGCDYADGFLLAVKDRLAQAIKPALLYRVDTTTFGFLLELEDARKLLPALESLGRTNQIVELQDIPQLVNYSVGTVCLEAGMTAAEALRALFTASDRARELGQVHCVYEKEHDRIQQRAFSILSPLAQAMRETDQLSLVYQPKVAFSSGRCVGVEALLRWRHPVLGVVSPAEFIPLAEKTALMKRITRWVLQAGIAQVAQWQCAGHSFAVAFNVSAFDLDRPAFVGELAEFISAAGADPSLIEIEFTESALSLHPQRVQDQLVQIRDMGVKVAIDDFGTGYSNLSYLKKVPANSIKIDQSFVRQLPDERRDHTIVPAMIQLGHALGYRVVAEGIESQEAYELLRSWGCDEAQGYWVAKPMSGADLQGWIGRAHPGLRP